MRRVRNLFRRAGGFLTLLVILGTVPSAYADGIPFEPPEARIRPPIGATAQEPVSFTEAIWAWLMARIGPPGGLQ